MSSGSGEEELATPSAADDAAPARPAAAAADDQAAAEAAAQLAADPGQPPPDAADLDPREVRSAVEALLFASSKPVAAARLAGCLPGAGESYLDGLLRGLAERYDQERRGWELRRIANGWQLLTRRELYPWVRQLDKRELPTALTRSAMETLAVVAYQQPVTRGVIEDIRGVQVGPVLRQLMDQRLVQVIGRDEQALGRPLLYGTTEQFLARFGLGSIADLPKRHEFGA